MDEVFLWLQRTMLGMVDDEEEVFVELGRKLLTVHKYVVVNATTEAELSRAFWHEATTLARHGVVAAAEKEKKDAEEAAKKAAEKAAEKRAKREAERTAAEGARASAEGAEATGGVVEADAGGEARQEDEGAGRGEEAKETGTGAAVEEEDADEEEDVLKASGLGGGNNPKEDSVLLALPGFRFQARRRDVRDMAVLRGALVA